VSVVSDNSVLINENFDSNAANWTVVKGNWTVNNGMYQQSSLDSACYSMIGKISKPKFTIKLKARKTGGTDCFMIMFKVLDKDNFYTWTLGNDGNKRMSTQHCIDGKLYKIVEKSTVIENNIWYNIQINVSGDTIRYYLDNKVKSTYLSTTPKKYVYTSCTVDSTRGDIYWKAINYNDSEKNCIVQFQNLPPNSKFIGTVETMSNANLNKENTINEPNAVAPITTSFNLDDTNFEYTFPAHSLSVFHIYPKSAALQSENSIFTIPENSLPGTVAGIVPATGAQKYKFEIIHSSVNNVFSINQF